MHQRLGLHRVKNRHDRRSLDDSFKRLKLRFLLLHARQRPHPTRSICSAASQSAVAGYLKPFAMYRVAGPTRTKVALDVDISVQFDDYRPICGAYYLVLIYSAHDICFFSQHQREYIFCFCLRSALPLTKGLSFFGPFQ